MWRILLSAVLMSLAASPTLGQWLPLGEDAFGERPSRRYEYEPRHEPQGPISGLVRDGGARPDIKPEAPMVVAFPHDYPPSSIVIDSSGKRLYYVLGNQQAYMYPISVGREGFNWTGTETISRQQAWPDWYPLQEMRQRDPRLPGKMTGGTRNPLGAMALYLGSTLYRIHGTNDVKSIGQAQSSGCFRMMNASVVHLAGVAGVGTVVTVVASLPTGVELSQVPQAPRFLPAPSFRPGGPSIRRRMTIVICATTRCAGGKPVSERSSMTFRSSVLSLVCLAALAGQAAARDASLLPGWTDYRNERFGFSLRYPVDLFQPEKTSEAGDGQVFVSRDGATRLLVGALQNDAGQSPAAYRDYIARESYAGYRIDYRRLAANWFVLSGEGGGKTFYEKVMFSCAGRLINSFAMVYPTDQRDTFDRVVEGMEKSFRPGRECGDRAATLPPPVSEAPRSAEEQDRKAPKGPRSAMADRIARQRGHDVIVVLRRAGPPYDYKYLRGYASR